MSWLGQIEASALSTWIRESDAMYAFPGILIVHTLGMALAAGSVAAIGLRLLGVARQIPFAARVTAGRMDRPRPQRRLGHPARGGVSHEGADQSHLLSQAAGHRRDGG